MWKCAVNVKGAKMIIWNLTVLLCYFCCASSSQIEYDGYLHIKLKHSFDSVFTDRGNITVQSLRSGSYTILQQPLTSEERNQLRDLSARNAFYQLKAVVTGNDGTEASYSSMVKACMLAEAELTDILSISLDYTGRVVTVTMAVASTSTCEGAVVPADRLKQFTTSVYIRHTESGPIPDTASYIQKLERDREAKERGEVKDNRSFLAKYWMYIVPVVIIMVLSSATNPETGNGGSGGGR